MSLNVRWLTNGEKKVYTVTDSLNKTFSVYLRIEEVPTEILNYAEHIKEPTICGPETARLLGVQNILYPDWPKPCVHPDFLGEDCIAEMCKYFGPDNAFGKCKWTPEEEG